MCVSVYVCVLVFSCVCVRVCKRESECEREFVEGRERLIQRGIEANREQEKVNKREHSVTCIKHVQLIHRIIKANYRADSSL